MFPHLRGCGDSSKNEDIYSNIPPLEDIANMSDDKNDVREVNLCVEIPKFDLGRSYNSAKAWEFIEDSIKRNGGKNQTQITPISNSFSVVGCREQ